MSIPKNASDMLILPTNPPNQVWLAENGDIPGLVVMSRDVVLAPARNDTVPIQEVSVQTACH
ncbi:MAG TPA: hypothetical protein K8V63_11820 [Brevibacterium linens]|nr:hypothetical protein [Brevibacterium linens]